MNKRHQLREALELLSVIPGATVKIAPQDALLPDYAVAAFDLMGKGCEISIDSNKARTKFVFGEPL